MPLTVTVFLDSTTPIEAGVGFDLLSGGAVAASAVSVAGGTATFAVDPAGLTGASLRLSPQQPPPPP